MSPLIRSLLVILTFLITMTDPVRADSVIGQCLHNLDRIEQAKLVLAIERDLSPGNEIELESLAERMGREIPRCRSGGTYNIGRVGEKPTCSIAAHSREALESSLRAQKNKNTAKSLAAMIGTAGACLLALRFWKRKRPMAKGSWRRKLVILVAGYLVSGELLSAIWDGSHVSAPMVLQLLYLPFAPSLNAPMWL